MGMTVEVGLDEVLVSATTYLASSPKVRPWRTGSGHVVDVGLGAGVGDGALGGDAADEVGAVEKDDLEVVG